MKCLVFGSGTVRVRPDPVFGLVRVRPDPVFGLHPFRSAFERLLVKAMGFGLTLFFGRRYSIYLEPSSAAFKGAASSGGDCFAKFAAMNLWRFTISAGAIVRIFARG